MALGYGFYSTHPGEIVNDELEARGISQKKFAEAIGMSPTALNEILKGRRSITPATALLVEAALDIPADALMKLQTKYNMRQARNDPKIIKRLEKIARAASVL